MIVQHIAQTASAGRVLSTRAAAAANAASFFASSRSPIVRSVAAGRSISSSARYRASRFARPTTYDRSPWELLFLEPRRVSVDGFCGRRSGRAQLRLQFRIAAIRERFREIAPQHGGCAAEHPQAALGHHPGRIDDVRPRGREERRDAGELGDDAPSSHLRRRRLHRHQVVHAVGDSGSVDHRVLAPVLIALQIEQPRVEQATDDAVIHLLIGCQRGLRNGCEPRSQPPPARDFAIDGAALKSSSSPSWACRPLPAAIEG